MRTQCSRTINVDRLKPFHERVDGGLNAPPGPVSDPEQEGEHEVELLHNRTEKRGVTLRRRGRTSADDEWLSYARRSSGTARRRWLSTTPPRHAGGPPVAATRALAPGPRQSTLRRLLLGEPVLWPRRVCGWHRRWMARLW